MSGLVSRRFYMPHYAQSSKRFLKLFTELTEQKPQFLEDRFFIKLKKTFINVDDKCSA